MTANKQFDAELPRQPHRNEQLKIIPLKSPAELEGAFRFLLREHFKDDEIWNWEPNPTNTKISIEVGSEANINFNDKKPSIWIEHGQTPFGEVVLGNRGPDQPSIFKTRTQHYYTQASADMRVVCSSPRRTESVLLADKIQKFIHFSASLICGIFGFRNMSPVTMNSTQMQEKDEKHFITPLMFRVSYELRWATIPAAAPLNRLLLKLQDEDAGEESIREIILDVDDLK